MAGNNANGVTPGLEELLAPRIAALETRLTAIEQLLAQKIPGFEKVGGRVEELSAAALAINGRLDALTVRMAEAEQATPLPAEERMVGLERSVQGVSDRLGTLEASRSRGGLSGRLTGIEQALATILNNQNPPGGERK